MQRYESPQCEQGTLASQQEHESRHQPEQSNESYRGQTNNMTKGPILGAKSEESDVSLVCKSLPSVYPSEPDPGLTLLSQEYDQDDLIPLRTWRHHGAWAAFTFAYRTNSCRYRDTSIYRHRDFASRVEMLPLHDAQLKLGSGKLSRLIVQRTDDVYEAQGMTTWCRTYVRKPSPYYIRLAIWTIDYTHDSQSWIGWCIQVLRTIPVSLVTMILVSQSTFLVDRCHRADWHAVLGGTCSG